jgi:hypothetical protein
VKRKASWRGPRPELGSRAKRKKYFLRNIFEILGIQKGYNLNDYEYIC